MNSLVGHGVRTCGAFMGVGVSQGWQPVLGPDHACRTCRPAGPLSYTCCFAGEPDLDSCCLVRLLGQVYLADSWGPAPAFSFNWPVLNSTGLAHTLHSCCRRAVRTSDETLKWLDWPDYLKVRQCI